VDKLIYDNPKNWLLETLYNADKADYETFRVYTCLVRYIDDNRNFTGITEEVVPNVLRFKPLTDLADDCLFSVAFFPKVIKSRQTRRGAPGVSFYSYTGKHAFTSTGYPAVANHWEFWIDYINSRIKLYK